MRGIKIGPIQKLVYAAALLALNILLNRLIGMAQVGPFFSFARIAPGTSIVLLSSLLLGPFYGAFIGVAGDALGWVILGQWTGAFNFFLSFYYFIAGFVPYFVGRLFTGEKTKALVKALFMPLFVAVFFTAILAIWFAPGIQVLFQKAALDLTIAKIIASVVIALGGVISVVSYVFMRRPSNKLMGGMTLEATFGVSLVHEILACFLKPLAFIAFYSLILGQSFTEATGFDYGSLVVITAMFAMVNIPLNAYLLTLYCRSGYSLFKGGADEKKE